MNSSDISVDRSDGKAVVEAGSTIIAGSVVAAPFMLLVAAVWALSFVGDDQTFLAARQVAPIVLVGWALALGAGTAVYLVGRAQRATGASPVEVTDRSHAGAASS